MHQTDEIAVQSRAGQAVALLFIDVQQGLFRKSTPIFRAELLLDTIKVLPFGSADWQLHPRLHPGEGDLVVRKQHGNAFEDTSLHPELAARGVGRIIATGLVTHGCVRATCEGALALDYAVVLAADSHSS